MIMKFYKAPIKYLIAVTSLFFLVQQKSLADGFPLRPGRLLLNPSISYFFANKGWDSLRALRAFPANGQFTSTTFTLSAEYGISRRWSVVALMPYASNTYQQTGYTSSNRGLTDLETGIRYYLANINYIYYFMLQGTVITPMYVNNPGLGYGLTGAELKLSFAGSGHLFGANDYFTIEDGVRQYFGTQGPWQDRYSATFGLSLDKKFKNQISVSFGGFYSVSDFKKFNVNPALDKNFAFNQVSLSYGHAFSKEFSVFVSGGTFVNGRNTGDGSSVSLSLILRPFK